MAEDIFHPNNLIVKKVGGSDLTGLQLFEFIKVTIFIMKFCKINGDAKFVFQNWLRLLHLRFFYFCFIFGNEKCSRNCFKIDRLAVEMNYRANVRRVVDLRIEMQC